MAIKYQGDGKLSRRIFCQLWPLRELPPASNLPKKLSRCPSQLTHAGEPELADPTSTLHSGDCTTLILGLNLKWKNRHVDVKSAFKNSTIDRETYVRSPVNLPKGIRQNDIYLLLKALYGLHQAPLLWHKELADALKRIGFSQLHYEPAVLILREAKAMVLVVCYVDDLIFFSECDVMLSDTVSKFLNIFEGSDMGSVSWYLGVGISLQDDKLILSQTSYIEELAHEHDVI